MIRGNIHMRKVTTKHWPICLCLDTNYLIPQMSGEGSLDISTKLQPVHHYKSVELLTPELYSLHTLKATSAGSRY